MPPIYTIASRSSIIGTLIHDLKYNSVRALTYPLASILNQILPTPTIKTYVIPLPTITKHIRSRGLDHTLLLAKTLAKFAKPYQILPALIRHQNTTQVGSDKKTRQLQATNAYKINPKIKIDPSANYILLDDVWTTGASMKSAIKKLRQAGAQNITVAVLTFSE